jgi:hypothetical protein
MTHGNKMNKPYDKRIPALLQSKTNLTDAVNISVKREFIEETKKSIASDVLEKVNKMEGELVTMDVLKDVLE